MNRSRMDLSSLEAHFLVVLSAGIITIISMESFNNLDIAWKMGIILGHCVAAIAGLVFLQTPKSDGRFLCDETLEPSKASYERFCMLYTPVWIGIFGCIVVTGIYEQFTNITYLWVCGGLALPFWIVCFFPTNQSEAERPILERYSFKANVWLAVYGFVGNYWYTHYFYSVLKAAYTMPDAIRLNNVPICMFFATHFYFSSYHLFSNAMLRKICTTFPKTILRDALFVSAVLVFSYFTAFMETLTISSYPYWEFDDREFAYTVGSAFYGIYFIVSFPAFYFFDRAIDQGRPVSLWDTIVSSCGYSLMILCLLDFVRLYLDIPLIVGANP